MLVLTRKAGEKVVLDGNIVLTIVEISGNRVKVAFEAPDDVVILRGELVDKSHDADLAAKPSDWRWERKPMLVGSK